MLSAAMKFIFKKAREINKYGKSMRGRRHQTTASMADPRRRLDDELAYHNKRLKNFQKNYPHETKADVKRSIKFTQERINRVDRARRLMGRDPKERRAGFADRRIDTGTGFSRN